MAKLIYLATVSLDGYMADGSGNIDWTAPDPEVYAFVHLVLRPVGTFLFGRRMYETMLYWERQPLADGGPQGTPDFAELWRAADKVVYSTTLKDVTSARTRLERAFDPAAVRRMKSRAARDISVGGALLAGQAIAAGVVDEIHLFVVPILLVAGTRALPDRRRLRLDLIDERRFASGVVYLRYGIPA